MDLAYWGFRRWPFERSFAADRFFASPLHDEALARLLFLVEEGRRSGVLVGAARTGKSFLLKLLKDRSERLARLVVRCEANGIDGQELALQIAQGCHVSVDIDSSSGRIWQGLQARFSALSLIQQSMVVLIDHFDQADVRCLGTISRLHQLADSMGVRLTVILATRNRAIPAALMADTELRIDLEPWTESECTQFVHHAMNQAGSPNLVFTDEAIAAVHVETGGVPGDAVTLCHLSLLVARARDEKLVISEDVLAASSELRPRASETAAKPRLVIERPFAMSAGS